jgi:hypothetical protein
MTDQLLGLFSAEQGAHPAPDGLNPEPAQQQQQIDPTDSQVVLQLRERHQIRLSHGLR